MYFYLMQWQVFQLLTNVRIILNDFFAIIQNNKKRKNMRKRLFFFSHRAASQNESGAMNLFSRNVKCYAPFIEFQWYISITNNKSYMIKIIEMCYSSFSIIP
jgi:hypothetical protein